MANIVDRLVNEHKLIRRLSLVWACWLISVVVLRVTRPESLEHVTDAVAAVVIAVIGILATIVGFYQWSRQRDDK